MAEDVWPISRASPSSCRKIKYSIRSDTPGSCPTGDHCWSATQARLLAPRRLAAAGLLVTLLAPRSTEQGLNVGLEPRDP